MNPTGKTPVQILQEYMIKQGQTPQFELIQNSMFTHENLFKYRVEGIGKIAVGSGSSKKEAKHEAARLLLMQLTKGKSEEDHIVSEVSNYLYSPYEDNLKDNTVGILQNLCCDYQLACPVYTLIKDEGPPHSKQFTFKCTISTISSEATARTKKQAKHKCAESLIAKIRSSLKLRDNRDEETPKIGETEMTGQEESRIKDAVEALTGKFLQEKEELTAFGIPIPLMVTVLKDSQMLFSEHFKKIVRKPKEYFTSLPDAVQTLRDVAEDLNFTVIIRNFPSKPPAFISYVHLVSKPSWSFLGMGNNESDSQIDAAVNALLFLSNLS